MKCCSVCGKKYDDAATVCADDGGLLAAVSEDKESNKADPLIGRIFDGKYKMERRIGSGAMGAVYVARHTLIDKQAAIKTILPHWLSNEELLARFKREAKAAASIEHPNIVPVNDFGETEEGVVYMVMEYVKGESLGDIIEREGRLSPERVIKLVSQVCRAIAAHHAGIVHRDIKPDNIMVQVVDGEERARVTDFGIAKLIDEKKQLTAPNYGVGTPYYMSPEQCGSGNPVEGRSDIYSIGVMLYRLLSGSHPIEGPNPIAIAYKHINGLPKPLNELCPEILERLAKVVMKALEKDPANRQQSAGELADELLDSLQSDHVFISYSGLNRDRVLGIVEQLKVYGVPLWLDRGRFEDNADYGAKIENAIKYSKAVLMMSSNASMRSRFVKQDLQCAWKYGKPCLTLSIESVGFVDQIKYWLAGGEMLEIKDDKPNLWLSQVLGALESVGVVSGADRLIKPEQNRNEPIARGLGASQKSLHAETDPSTVIVSPVGEGLEGLRSIAKFTDQIWPVSAESPQRPVAAAGVRGLGAPQDNIKRRHKLGGRVRLAIETEREGHLLLLDQGPEEILYCLCPSLFAPNTLLRSGRNYLPQEGSQYDSFVLTGMSGREQLLAVITDRPLDLKWMSADPNMPARELSKEDVNLLLAALRNMPSDRWTVLSTYFDLVE